jgi:hypothetical protein
MKCYNDEKKQNDILVPNYLREAATINCLVIFYDKLFHDRKKNINKGGNKFSLMKLRNRKELH